MEDPYKKYAAKATSIAECWSGEQNALERGSEEVAAAYRRRAAELQQSAPPTISRRKWLLSQPTATGTTPERSWHPVSINLFGYPVDILFRLGPATEALANFQELLPHLGSRRSDSISTRLTSCYEISRDESEICIAADNDALDHLRPADERRTRVSLVILQGLSLLACLYGIGGSVLGQLNQGRIRSRNAPDIKRFFELYFGKAVLEDFDEYQDDPGRYIYRGVTIAIDEWNTLFDPTSSDSAGALSERVHTLREQRAAREARAEERLRRHKEAVESKERKRLDKIEHLRRKEDARIASLDRLAANDLARVSSLVRSLCYQVRHELRLLDDGDRRAVSIDLHEANPSVTTTVAIGNTRALTIVPFQHLESGAVVTSGLRVSAYDNSQEIQDFADLDGAVQYVTDCIARKLARM